MVIESLTANQIKLMRLLKLKRGIPRQEILVKFDWSADALNKSIQNLKGFFIIVEIEKRKK